MGLRGWIGGARGSQGVLGGREGIQGIPWGHRVGLMSLFMIHKAYMPVYSDPDFSCGRTGRDGTGPTEGSTRGPRGPKKYHNFLYKYVLKYQNVLYENGLKSIKMFYMKWTKVSRHRGTADTHLIFFDLVLILHLYFR